MKRYSAYCLQNGTYFHTGANTKSTKECTRDIILYLLAGEERPKNMKDREILEMFEVEIHQV